VRALFVIVAVFAGSAAAETEELPLNRTGTAPSPCPDDRTCAVDLERTVAGVDLVVHHRDSETDRIASIRIGAVDVGLGMYALDAAGSVELTQGTLDDRSAAVAIVIGVDRGALVTVCGVAAPACTRQVRVECPDQGCHARVARGMLSVLARGGRRSYRITRSYLP
jgi:hypothetical protein